MSDLERWLRVGSATIETRRSCSSADWPTTSSRHPPLRGRERPSRTVVDHPHARRERGPRPATPSETARRILVMRDEHLELVRAKSASRYAVPLLEQLLLGPAVTANSTATRLSAPCGTTRRLPGARLLTTPRPRPSAARQGRMGSAPFSTPRWPNRRARSGARTRLHDAWPVARHGWSPRTPAGSGDASGLHPLPTRATRTWQGPVHDLPACIHHRDVRNICLGRTATLR